MADEEGNVTDTYDYEAFGELIDSTGESENSYRFTGEQFDGDLGDYYLRDRFYDQGSGRFLRKDVYEGNIFKPESLHKYVYANGNPVTWKDPSGFYASLAEFTAANKVRDILAGIQVDSYGHLVSATIQDGDYGTRDFIIAAAIGLSIPAAQRILPFLVKGGLKLGSFIYENLFPAQLTDELLLAARLGVSAFKVTSPQFAKAVDSGEIIKWVVTLDGELLMVPKYVDGAEISHAVINQGKNVIAAGEAMLAGDPSNGYYLLQISNHSGHYQPSALGTKIGKTAFEIEGVNVAGAIEDFAGGF